jgi:NADH:ubiquinone reductase (H+-translocating)
MKARSVLALAAGGIAGFTATRAYRARRPVQLPSRGTHVVILGAGFAGLSAASKLVELVGDQVRVSLLDRHNYHLFTPMLYQVATCGVVPYDVAIPLRSLVSPRGIRFRKARVDGIDFDGQTIQTDTGHITYDCLVIALGSTTNYFGNESAQQNSRPLKSLEGGLAIRNQVIDTLEEAVLTSDGERRKQLLTFVIIGGGATGVETAGALADAVRHLIPKGYPALNAKDVRVIVIEAESKLLGHMNAEMAKIALQELHAAGVEVWLNTRAKNVAPNRVETEDGRSLSASIVLWATGVRAPDVVGDLSIDHGKHGSIVVNEYLQLPNQPNVFGIGDNAEVKSQGRLVPLLAATAVQEGHAVALNIVRLLRGEPLIPFRYKDLGNVVSVGHRVGVAEIAGRVIGGVSGWLAWRVVHLARIATFRNKLATALDWTTGYFYDVDTARLEVEPESKAA